MVSYEGLNAARPGKWHDAADEWESLAKYALAAAKSLREQGAAPLAENWTSAVGKLAADDVKKLANQLESAYTIMLGSKMVLEGVASSIETAQSTMREAAEIARAHDIELGTDGLPVEHARPHETQEKLAARDEIADLRAQALRQADEADNTANARLMEIAGKTGVVDPGEALKIQTKLSHAEMAILASQIPVNEDASTVRHWWNGLSAKQQHNLMLSDPVTLAGLNGIPEETKRELRGPDGKYNRVELVKYALENWNKDDPTDFGNNCTNFVSEAMLHAGVQRKMDSWTGVSGDDTWGKVSGIGWDWFDSRAYHSDTWGSAENHQNFMLEHGGREVPRSEVRPGDIVYYEQAGPNAHIEGGETHHAAIVTAVTPDGEIKYTQHTDSRVNVSLEGRLPATEKSEGDQNVRIVRINPDWY